MSRTKSYTRRKSITWLAKSYFEFSEECRKYEEKIYHTKQEEDQYITNREYMNKIKDSFDCSVNAYNKEKVWGYFFNKKTIEPYEEKIVDEEINRWITVLAGEMGINLRG